MAILKFKCNNCGKVFDELVTERNKDSLQCPDCQSNKLERAYQGKCLSPCSSSSGCSGSCGNCKGCGH